MRPSILDGGMGHLLKQRGMTMEGLPWEQQFLSSNLANIMEPSTVIAAHLDYISAGAQYITTNNFVTTPYNMRKVGRESDLVPLIEAAGQVASRARELGNSQVGLLGCLPPLCESYQHTNLPKQQDMVDMYRLIARHLDPYVDIFLCETLSTTEEVMAATSGCGNLGKPVWVSCTLEDSLAVRLRSGESLEKAVRLALAAGPQVEAVLCNCCSPLTLSSAVPVLHALVPEGVRVGAYGNGFKTTTSQWLCAEREEVAPVLELPAGDYDADDIITPWAYGRYAAQWIDEGATLVGGCCGIGPPHIRHIADMLRGT